MAMKNATSVANHPSSFTVAAVVLCVMLTVKKGIFVARAFHVVHPESAIDSSKFGLHSGVTRREPQHPMLECKTLQECPEFNQFEPSSWPWLISW